MKIPEKKNTKKKGLNKKSVVKPKKEQVQIVAHEIKFARLLSGNEKKTRDRALKTLKKWLLNCFEKKYEFKEDDFLRIWKGLFYAVWMSDKPLVQEELCESIAGILDLFPTEQYHHALTMVKVGFKAMAAEWYGIDHHRMDKCLMLVRRYLRGSLRVVARCGWSSSACSGYADMLSGKDGIMALKTPAYARNAISMILHIIDCYLEEISKVSSGAIPPLALVSLLSPFCRYMCRGDATSVIVASRRLLTSLLRASELALAYLDKTRAWEQMGCPAGGPDSLQQLSDDDGEGDDDDGQSDGDDEGEKALDPRAGRVSVFLKPLPVPATEIADLLTEMKAKASGKAYKRIDIMIQRFRKLAEGEYPLKVQDVERDEGPQIPPPEQVASNLQSLEKQLMAASDELALRGLSRKHRKRLLAKTRAGLSILDDELLTGTRNNAAGEWLVEETKQDTKKIKKQNSSNKENFEKKNKKRKIEATGDTRSKKIKTENKHSNVKRKDTSVIKSKIADTKPTNKGIQKKNAPDESSREKTFKTLEIKKVKTLTVVSKKVKIMRKKLSTKEASSIHSTPKKVKFVLKNNSMQETMDYYKSVRQSPNIPFDSSKTPSKANLKPSTPSPINPFFKKKWKIH